MQELQETPEVDFEDRFSRQAELIPRDKLLEYPVSVIGVGAVGREVARQLAAIGVREIQIVDFDTVESSNVASQNYRTCDIGEAKVEATAQMLCDASDDIQVTAVNTRWRPKMELNPIVFCCVDTMTIRTKLFEKQFSVCELFVDGRMAGENMRVLAVSNDDKAAEYYRSTLFTDAEAYQGSCTSKSIVNVAAITAALMVHQFRRFLCELPLEPDVQFSLLSMELTTR